MGPHRQSRLRPQLHVYRSGTLGSQAGGKSKGLQSILIVQAGRLCSQGLNSYSYKSSVTLRSTSFTSYPCSQLSLCLYKLSSSFFTATYSPGVELSSGFATTLSSHQPKCPGSSRTNSSPSLAALTEDWYFVAAFLCIGS